MKVYQGTNIGGYFSQVKKITENHINNFITKTDIQQIKDWKFNIIRLPVDHIFFTEENNPTLFKEERLKHLDRVLKWAEEFDIPFILDLHKSPGHSFDSSERHLNDIWESGSENRDNFLKIWDMLSNRYKNYKNIMYEILNEPVAPTNQLWYDLVEDTIKIMRENDQDHYIMVESNLWGDSPNFEMKKFDDEKIFYSFHFYQPLFITHQIAPWTKFYKLNLFRETIKYPGVLKAPSEFFEKIEEAEPIYANFFKHGIERYWDKNALEDMLKPVLDFKNKYNVPMLCGEFGMFINADVESRFNWLNDLISLFKKHDISYTYWTYKNMDFGIVDYTEQYADNPNYTKKERLDNNTLKVLQNGI